MALGLRRLEEDSGGGARSGMRVIHSVPHVAPRILQRLSIDPVTQWVSLFKRVSGTGGIHGSMGSIGIILTESGRAASARTAVEA